MLEEKLFATLLTTTPEADLTAVREQAARELAPYRRRMQAVQIRQIEQQFLHKRLLEKYKLPRLSLFYMSQCMKLRIEKCIYGGAGLARADGKTIFVPFTLPDEDSGGTHCGDKRSFANAELDAVLQPANGSYSTVCIFRPMRRMPVSARKYTQS